MSGQVLIVLGLFAASICCFAGAAYLGVRRRRRERKPDLGDDLRRINEAAARIPSEIDVLKRITDRPRDER